MKKGYDTNLIFNLLTFLSYKSTYWNLYDCMFLSCHVRVSESIHTLYTVQISTQSTARCTDKYSEHSSIIWPVLANGWVFVYELNGPGFQSSCSHLNFTFRVCFERRVPCNSGNYRVRIHSETRTWHDQNISHKVLVVFVLSSTTVTEVN